MPKTLTRFTCQQCGAQRSKWAGRCEQCGTWNSLVEEAAAPVGRSGRSAVKLASTTLSAMSTLKTPRLGSGMAEVDQVLGGGIVPGAVMLLSGDPGIGKSTLALQLAANLAAERKALYISGEESAAQIKLRADRLGLGKSTLELVADTDVDAISATIDAGGYDLVIIDSIQTMASSSLTGAPGTAGQVTTSAQTLQAVAKRRHAAILLIGHVTKEGSIAGPKILEHLVDVVLYLEGDPGGNFKALRGIKNRFGSTSEVAIFELGDHGLTAVANPSAALLAERQPGPGSVVLATMEGTRPLLVEVQALVATTVFGYPKRTAAGFDLNRLNLLAAVLTKRANLNLQNQDIYVNIVGGLKLTEPAADFAIILAIASAFTNRSLPDSVVVFGEVGLNGEIRSVSQARQRLQEAKKLGFTAAIGPARSPESGIQGQATVAEAIRQVLGSVIK